MPKYPETGIYGVENLFLAYLGYSIGSDGTRHYQYWEINDLLPIITYLDLETKQAKTEMFTDFLFLAMAIKNSAGQIKYIERNDQSPADSKDWASYTAELFAPGKNLNALYTVVFYNGLGRPIQTDVWIALPYPHPKIFGRDTARSTAVINWINAFLKRWTTGSYGKRLTLRGFYWPQESIYFNGPANYDSKLLTQVNNYIHQLALNSQPLKALWIPYQKAFRWEDWYDFGFDLAVLQPSYYFDPAKSIAVAAADAYQKTLCVELELDLGVTTDPAKRRRFIEYLDLGTTGGYDQSGRYFGPYLQEGACAWYMGGWYWNNRIRNHALLTLYSSHDPLYDYIGKSVKGVYRSGTAH